QRVIDDRDVGLAAERLGDGVLAVFSFGNDLPPLVRFEDRPQAGADYFVVVGDQNPGHDAPTRRRAPTPRNREKPPLPAEPADKLTDPSRSGIMKNPELIVPKPGKFASSRKNKHDFQPISAAGRICREKGIP